jgi:hypothetical protein
MAFFFGHLSVVESFNDCPNLSGILAGGEDPMADG